MGGHARPAVLDEPPYEGLVGLLAEVDDEQVVDGGRGEHRVPRVPGELEVPGAPGGPDHQQVVRAGLAHGAAPLHFESEPVHVEPLGGLEVEGRPGDAYVGM